MVLGQDDFEAVGQRELLERDVRHVAALRRLGLHAPNLEADDTGTQQDGSGDDTKPE